MAMIRRAFPNRDYKKDIFGSFEYEFELSHKSRRSRAYHKDGVLHIINSEETVYHHCERKYSRCLMNIYLRLMICRCFRNR